MRKLTSKACAANGRYPSRLSMASNRLQFGALTGRATQLRAYIQERFPHPGESRPGFANDRIMVGRMSTSYKQYKKMQTLVCCPQDECKGDPNDDGDEKNIVGKNRRKLG